MLRSHLKFAIKSVRKHKIPSLINFLGFTIGLTGAVLLMAILLHDLSYDSYHANSDRLYRLSTKIDLPNGARHFASSSVLTGQYLPESVPEIEATIRTRYLQVNLEIGEKLFSSEAVLFVDKDFYSGFKVELVQGKYSSEPGDILISESSRERLFGEEEAIGQMIIAQGPFGSRPFQITGVFKNYPTNVSIRPGILADFRIIEALHNTNYASIMPGLNTYLLTNGKLSQQELQEKLNIHFQQALPENIREVIVHEAQSFAAIHFTRGLEFDMGQKHDLQTLWVLGILASFIITSTFINFFNMQTALAVQRMKELSIKRALGQTWLSNVLQTSLESFVIILPVVAVSGLLIHWCLGQLEAYTDLSLKTGWLTNESLPLFMAGVFLSFWLLASITSIVLLSISTRNLRAQKAKSGNAVFRRSLIGLQFALAGFFILNALVISGQLRYINSLDLGYENDGLITISLNGIRDYEHAKTVKDALETVSGVKSTSLSQSAIFGTQGKANFTVQMDTGTVNHMLNTNFIDPDYIETSEMTLLVGENIRSGNRTILLNEKAVQTLGFSDYSDAIGRQMSYSARDTSLNYTISGVISDYHYTTMHQAIEPIVLFENELGGYFNMTVRTEGQSFESIIAELENEWDRLFAGQQLSYRIMEDVLEQAYEEDFQKGEFYQWATLLLVSIAALGIFGLTYYYADQKRKEIGVRKAIGARLGHIIGQIAKPIAIVCALAVLVAIPSGIYVSQQWLNGYEYGISIGTFQIVNTIALMFILSSIALLYPGLKASRINPVEALREE